MRVKAPGVIADSAGTGDWHVGAPPHAPMQDVAQAMGYEMSDLRARQLKARDFAQFDLILGMDDRNLRDTLAVVPKGSNVQIGLLTDYLPNVDGIPDPYYTHDYNGALQLIEACIDALLEEIA